MPDFDSVPSDRGDTLADGQLVSPLLVGAWALRHRIVFTPETTGLAMDGLPSAALATFHGERTTAGGLVISEPACVTSGMGQAVPGLHDVEQANAWRAVTLAIQASSGIAIARLRWPGRAPRDGAGFEAALEGYRRSAEYALDAGFDGVELEEVEAGPGTPVAREERASFLVESVETLAAIWEAERVGVRLAPAGASWPSRALLNRLEQAAVAFVHLHANADLVPGVRAAFAGRLLVSGIDDATRGLRLGADLIGLDQLALADAHWIARRVG